MIRHTSARRLTVVAILLCIAPLATARDASSDNLRRFDQVWRTVRDRFYDPKLHGLDWEAIGQKYRPRAERATTFNALQQAINDMLGELKASHLHYAISDDFDYWLLRTVFMPDEKAVTVPHIGVQGVQEGETFVVRAILEGSPAAKAGIQYGDRLFGVGGRPFSTVGTFRGREGQTVRLKVERPGTGEITINVEPVMQTAVEAYAQAITKSARVIQRDGKRLGYVHLWCLAGREFLRAYDESVLHKLADTDGLVLDLRDGYGGSPDRFDYSLFRPATTFTTIPRRGSPSTENNGYGKPLVVLINEGSRSAKEYFAYEIKKSGRGTLVGTRTMGAFLAAGGFPIADDGLLMLPIMDLRLDGKRLEGVGVSPDIEVAGDNSYSPDDKQIAKGLEVLLDKLRVRVSKE